MIAAGKTQTNTKENLKFLSKRKNHPIHLQYTEDSKITQFPSRLQRPTGETQEAQYPIIITNQRYQLTSLITPEINKDLPSKILVTTQNQLGYPLSENITYELLSLKPLQKLGEQYDEGNLPIDKKFEKERSLPEKTKNWK